MSFQFDWPKEWDALFVRRLKTTVQDRIRSAMRSAPNGQVRGQAVVEELFLGNVPPSVTITSIKEITAQRTVLSAKVSYLGDGYMSLHGLEINLDSMSHTNAVIDGGDTNHQNPFFFNFNLKMCNIILEDEITLVLEQEVKLTPPPPDKARPQLPVTFTHYEKRGGSGGMSASADSRLTHIAYPTSPMSARMSSDSAFSSRRRYVGVGILAGSSKHMKQPAKHEESAHGGSRGAQAGGTGINFWLGTMGRRTHDASPGSHQKQANQQSYATSCDPLSSTAAYPSSQGSAATAAANIVSSSKGASVHGSESATFGDIADGEAVVAKRTLSITFGGDPIRDFTVISNFGSLPGSNRRVKIALQSLLKPAMENLRISGLNFDV